MAQTAADMLAQHKIRREALIQIEASQHFSYDLEATLTDAERTANTKL